ncbi:putative ribonuclease H-like domain-containing protein [Tanacetum coccineum]
MVGSHAYHEGEKILKEDMKESEFQWQRNLGHHGIWRLGNGDASRKGFCCTVETPTNALVVQDGIGGYDWSFQAEEGITNFALMAYTSQGSSSSSSSDSEKSLEARIVVHEKNEAVYEEDIAFLKYDVQVKDISIKDLKNQLEEALKEKDDLKLKLEKFEESSKNLTKLINSQISAKDKAGLGYDSQMNESEVVHSVFNSRESDVDNSPVNDRFKTGEGFHAVPPPYTGNYMPSRPDLSFAGLDDSVYKTKVSETETSISKTSKDIVEKPKTVRPSAPIIEDWDTDSDNDSVFRPKTDQTKPKFTKINFVKSDENVKSVNKENTHKQVEYPRKSQSPRAVATKSGQMLVNVAKQNSPRAAASISTARPVNTVAPKPNVNDALPTTYSYFKEHSLVRRAFNQKSATKTNNFNEKVNTARVNNVTTIGPKAVVSGAEGNGENAVKSLAYWIWRPTGNVIENAFKDNGSYMLKRFDYVDLQGRLNRCSRHMTGNKSFLIDYQEVDGGFVTFTGSPKGGKITGKGKIRTGKLDFKDVYFVKELKFNLFSVSQMCDKKNNFLFTETGCLVLSPDFKLLDERGLTYLFAKATIDESNLWHKRLGHINFKTMNKLVKGNLVRGLNGFSRHMTEQSFLQISRVDGVFAFAEDLKEDETSGILKTFITGIEYQINHKVKIIRCDNETEFKNNDMNQFYGMKGIKKEFSVARTTQQNGVAERKNKTLIEVARTMLADSLLPTTFWAEAVSTACYVQNRVLVTKPHNKTPYELLHGRPPSISFMRPFGCPVTILNTLDPLGKFDGKADEGFFVGYSINSKAFRVFNTRTRKVEENLHITFLENKPNVAGSGPDWLFDIDLLTNSMNYEPVTAGNQTNKNAGIKDNVDAVPTQQYILLPLLYDSPQSLEDAVADDAGKKTNEKPANEGERNGQEKEGGASNKEDDQNVQDFRAALDNLLVQQKEGYANNTNRDSTVSPSVSAAGQSFTNADDLPIDPLMPDLEDTTDLLNSGIFSGAYDDEDVSVENDLNNLKTTMNVSPIPTTRIHKVHPNDQIIGDINLATQTRRLTNISKEHAMVSYINKLRRTNHKDYQNCLFACFLSKRTQEDLPNGKRAIGTKWVFRNKKDERGIVVRNKARLVAQGYTQEEMDMKSAFLYGTIKEEVYVCQPPSFEDPQFLVKVYKVKQKDDGIFVSQDKYVADILKIFDFATVKTTSTLMVSNKALIKDAEAEDIDVHLYRSMIGSLMYLTASSDYSRASIDRKSTTGDGISDEFGVKTGSCKVNAARQDLVLLGEKPFNDTYETPKHTQKVFANMRKKGKSFLGTVTSLFQSMLAIQAVEGKGLGQPIEPQPTPSPTSSSHEEQVSDETVHKELGDRVERAATTAAHLDAE